MQSAGAAPSPTANKAAKELGTKQAVSTVVFVSPHSSLCCLSRKGDCRAPNPRAAGCGHSPQALLGLLAHLIPFWQGEWPGEQCTPH